MSETIAIMNAYPYASGHLLVMPIRHVSEISEPEPSESAELWSVTSEAITAIEAAYAGRPQPRGEPRGAAGAGILLISTCISFRDGPATRTS